MRNTFRSASIALGLLRIGTDHQRSTASHAVLSIARQFGSTQPPTFLKYALLGPTDSQSSRQIGCREPGWDHLSTLYAVLSAGAEWAYTLRWFGELVQHYPQLAGKTGQHCSEAVDALIWNRS